MPPTAAPVAFPLGAPTFSGNQLTVDTALKQPTRITRRIADLTLQNFIVSRIFAVGGEVTGGAVVYDQATLNELYLDRPVERVAPGDEFPIVTSARQAPKVAEVEKYGGKIFITDEARDRNDSVHFNNQVTQLANTIVRKTNTRAVAELEAAIAALGGAGTFVGHSWSAYQPNGTSPTAPAGTPGADLLKAQFVADTEELGVTYDLLIVNPAEALSLATGYGDRLQAMLDSAGIREVFPSNRVAAGTAYVVARGQVGGLRIEKPLGTETWREPKTERTWVQSSVRPVMYVTNPFSIKKLTGLS
jgi:hypothetical protein